ncbi:MAG: DUF3179 domain-containing (seleno)protein [Phycisphaerae bacterium]
MPFADFATSQAKSPETSEGTRKSSRFRSFLTSGGYIVILSALLVVAVVIWRGSVIISQWNDRAIGNGVDIDSYGYDTSNLTVDDAYFVAAGYPRDGIRPLTNPDKLTVAEANEFHKYLRKEHHHKFIVGSDLVAGVMIDGVATAYPLRLLAWHQVVNDDVGGVPIVVTYDPLCDSTVVFDRRVANEMLEFGTSGLVYNSNLVFYSQGKTRMDESLWSQLGFGAIAGRHAGAELRIVPFSVLPWDVWRRLHPDTTVMKLDLDRLRLYRQTFGWYYGSDELKFPVSRIPNETHETLLKSSMIAVNPRQGGPCYLVDDIAAQADASGHGAIKAGDREIRVAVAPTGDAAWVDGQYAEPVTVVPCFRFAAYAFGFFEE